MDVMSFRILCKQEWNSRAVISSQENTRATTKMDGWSAGAHVEMR